MATADETFEKARDAFRKAAHAGSITVMRTHALVGLAYLEHADAMSAVVEMESHKPAGKFHNT